MEDAELRKADRVIQHLSAIYKSYNRIKSTLEGGSECLEVVKKFHSDPKVLTGFKQNGTALLQGQLSRSRYNTLLGLLTARLIYLYVFALRFTLQLSLHVCRNAQRPGSITGMTKTELIDGLKRRRLCNFESPTVILVQNHKTG